MKTADEVLARLKDDCVICEMSGRRLVLVSLDDTLGEEAEVQDIPDLMRILAGLMATGTVAVAKMRFPETPEQDYIFHTQNERALACAQSSASTRN